MNYHYFVCLCVRVCLCVSLCVCVSIWYPLFHCYLFSFNIYLHIYIYIYIYIHIYIHIYFGVLHLCWNDDLTSGQVIRRRARGEGDKSEKGGWGWVFLERTWILNGMQFTTHCIEFVVVGTKQLVSSTVNVFLTRQTCGQRSSRAAESKRWAL